MPRDPLGSGNDTQSAHYRHTIGSVQTHDCHRTTVTQTVTQAGASIGKDAKSSLLDKTEIITVRLVNGHFSLSSKLNVSIVFCESVISSGELN